MPERTIAALEPAPGERSLAAAEAATPDLSLIAEAAAEAGRIALAHFRSDPHSWTKDDTSPVSEADMAVDRFLHRALTEARPDYGWLSEESADDLVRLDRPATFVVDPIDGTRAFLAGKDGWVVSVAVVVNGRPTAGCLVQPATGETFLAAAGFGAFHDGRQLALARRDQLPGTTVLGPKSLLAPALAEHGGPLVLQRYVPSLALRIAQVATGAVDATVTKGGSNDWDLAAADLLLHEAGGEIGCADGRGLQYGGANTRQKQLVASRPGLGPALRDLVAEVTRP